ncbi:hypothetical protein FDG2_1626 [Candidatus Protofrankia californiensis]|uniref:Type II restriction enzyme, methylase subunit n=1 Tax=Candidatus Protofrankia californiensis TaxID=1839754 RepID=A0A1C3NW00_9ACTN|nr:hypothetical protein FDG2_1626 [Candidatus Protofrankia californiensis]
MTTFFALHSAPDKASSLRSMISFCRTGAVTEGCYEVASESFRTIPGSPFAYWVPEAIMGLFSEGEMFEAAGRFARTTNNFSDNFRYVRLAWEISPDNLEGWRPWAKGSTERFYSDIDHVVAWDSQRKTYPGFTGTRHRPMERPASVQLFGVPGITWPLRAQRFSPSAFPAHAIFSVRSFMLAAPQSDLPWLLALGASSVVDYLYKMLLGRYEYPEFIVTALQRLPLPSEIPDSAKDELGNLALEACALSQRMRATVETSCCFVLPESILADLVGYSKESIKVRLDEIQARIDEISFSLYGVDASILTGGSFRDLESMSDLGERGDGSALGLSESSSVLSWAVGVAFGRFSSGLTERPDPLRGCTFDPFEERSSSPAISDLDLHGDPNSAIFVDDHGHPQDICGKVVEVLEKFTSEAVDGVPDVLKKDFFAWHIKKYSRSNRKAPIYWQLATPSASYSVWLYIHAFTRDTMFRVQNDFVAPKLLLEQRRLDELEQEASGRPSAAQRKVIEWQRTLVGELRAFLDEVRLVAPLWDPDLDDGVIINFAPLWRLVPQHKAWQTEVKKTWDELCKGSYDWSHLAMRLWPERVVPQCAADRSLAIAHGLEEVFWTETRDGWQTRSRPTRPLDELIAERTSDAVKAALRGLLDAPVTTTSGRGGRRRAATGTNGRGRR